MRRALLLTVLVLAVAACGTPTPQSDFSPLFDKDTATHTHTLTPTSTATPPPVPATLEPMTLLTPAIVVDDPTPVPTPDPTPFALSLPSEPLYFELPGPGSHIIESLRVVGFGGPSNRERVDIRLLGSDGRELVSYSTRLSVYPGNAGRFFATLSFSIPTLAEEARLEARTYSPVDGQLAHVASIELMLLSLGSPRILRGFQGAERITIFSPSEGSSVRGGVVRVHGAAWLSDDVPLVFQVIDSRGNVVGSKEVVLDVPEPGVVGEFEVEIPYQVGYTQDGRIAVYEPGTKIPGIVHYNSVSVRLRP